LTKPPDEDELVAVSPRHAVRLAPDYVTLVRTAPQSDFVVRTIVRREANGLPLMSAEIVIAGRETRERFPAAKTYPLHFRKTYYPARLHGDPRDEHARQSEAAALVGLPEPIGATHNVFRSCFLPGLPYLRLSPFGKEPEGSNIPVAERLPLAEAAGLFRMTEEAHAHLTAMHAGGLAHGDAELHNFIVSPSPLEVIVIDFEAAVRRETMDDDAWTARCHADLIPLLREAVFLQCALGQQRGALAELAAARMDELFKEPERFRRAIEERTFPAA
jgi:hypothetical protein